MVIVLRDSATNASTAVANSSKAIAIGNILTMRQQLCLKMYLNGMGLRDTLASHRNPPHYDHPLDKGSWLPNP